MTKICPTFLFVFFINLQVFGQATPIPENYIIIDSVVGDLDKDGKEELVVGYNIRKGETDESVPRELIVYKLQNSKWVIWKKSQQALYGSRDGGMMGDPFGYMEIKKGILYIQQNGGSSWKWGHTDKYRYQNGELYLIGYTGRNGKLCEYWEDVDFNLMTGKLVVKKEYEECKTLDQEIYKRENESVFVTGIKITLQNRGEKEIKFVTPKYRHEVYIAIKQELQ